MTGTTERTRRLRLPARTLVQAASIREVSLVGSPGRRYVHLALDGDEIGAMGRASRDEARKIGTG